MADRADDNVEEEVRPFDDRAPIQMDYVMDLIHYNDLDQLLDLLEIRTRALVQQASESIPASPAPWLRALLDQIQHLQHILWISRLHRGTRRIFEEPPSSEDEEDEVDADNEANRTATTEEESDEPQNGVYQIR